jgi:hypothetical protein
MFLGSVVWNEVLVQSFIGLVSNVTGLIEADFGYITKKALQEYSRNFGRVFWTTATVLSFVCCLYKVSLIDETQENLNGYSI